MATSSALAGSAFTSFLKHRKEKQDRKAIGGAAKEFKEAYEQKQKAKKEAKKQLNTPASLRRNVEPPDIQERILLPPTAEMLSTLPVKNLSDEETEGWCCYKEKAYFLEWAEGALDCVNVGEGYKRSLESLAIMAVAKKELRHIRIDGNFTEVSPLKEYEGWRFEEHFPVSFPEIERMAMVYVRWKLKTNEEGDGRRTAKIWRRGGLPDIVLI